MLQTSQIPPFQIRFCQSFDDFTACLEMQRAVWQFADLDITPLRSLIITKNSGGFTLGAFDEASGQLLAFAHALPAFDETLAPYYYSHMLAVRPDLQNSGIGLRLKFAQRDYALQRGIKLMVWTFDPMQSRNAYLNLIKLGGVVRHYKPNYYGDFSSSLLHQGLATDRLLVEWWLESPRVRALLENHITPSPASTPLARVAAPFDLDALKSQDLSQARSWQETLRHNFQEHFAAGLFCAGFEKGTPQAPSSYLFFPDPLRSTS